MAPRRLLTEWVMSWRCRCATLADSTNEARRFAALIVVLAADISDPGYPSSTSTNRNRTSVVARPYCTNRSQIVQ